MKDDLSLPDSSGSGRSLFCVSEKRTAIAAGDVCKGLGSLPTSGLGCDHLQALLATVTKPVSLTVLSVEVGEIELFSLKIQRDCGMLY